MAVQSNSAADAGSHLMRSGSRAPTVLVACFLILVTLAVFWQVGGYGFLSYDDDGYITANAVVGKGLTGEGAVWAITASHEANWHPLTWLSHMADCQLYGLNPRGHHLTNLLFHLVNTLILFALARRLTGSLWRGAGVALLFAVHPLHVESVAWVAERKDLLAAFFWLLAMSAYCRYTDLPGKGRYAVVFVLFACGLLAKPMVVTLPFVFLLTDWWPFGRFDRVPLRRLLVEKLPFILLSTGSSVVTVLAQKKGDALIPLTQISFFDRLENIPVAYVRYLAKMFWPENLAVFYPFVPPSLLQLTAALLFLGGISFAVVRLRLRAPYLLFGWFWFLGTLVPVIGLVQVGEQSMADRYTYLPLIGPFLMVVGGIADVSRGWRYRRPVLLTAAIATGTILALTARRQVATWHDSITLFTHAAAVTNGNYLALGNLGVLYAQQGLTTKGDDCSREALRMNPRYANAYYNLGVSLETEGRLGDAERYFAEAVRLKPAFAEAHYNLGVVQAKEGRLTEAATSFAEALRRNPDSLAARHNLEVARKLLRGSRGN